MYDRYEYIYYDFHVQILFTAIPLKLKPLWFLEAGYSILLSINNYCKSGKELKQIIDASTNT